MEKARANLCFIPVFILIVLASAVFLTGCAEYKAETNADDEMLKLDQKMNDLAGQLILNADDKEIKYELGKAYFDYALEKSKANNVSEGNEPILIEKDRKIGALLIHGFGASPWEMKGLAEFLASKNITVYAARLTGHGNSIEELKKTSMDDWVNDVSSAYSALSKMTDETYIIGMSTGGALSLYFSENAKNKPAGIVSIASPIYVRDKRAQWAFLAQYFVSSVPVKLTGEEKEHYYSSKPSVALMEFFRLIKSYKDELGKINVPVLIVQSSNDTTVDPNSAFYIYGHLGSKDKKIAFYDASQHVIIRSEQKDKVFDEIYSFIKQKTTKKQNKN